MFRDMRLLICCMIAMVLSASTGVSLAAENNGPEATVRALIQANVDKDMATLSSLMAHDADITSFTVGGRKYIGWPDFERDMQEEFTSTEKIEIPIRELKVWTKDDFAWFAMEVDYIRTVLEGGKQQRALLPLRETGVLERRNGHWVLLSWHESFRNTGGAIALDDRASLRPSVTLASAPDPAVSPDLSGEWDILEVEDDKRYKATLDKGGNGPYTQHGGRFTTTKYSDRLWQGTWHQPDNDREGGFELLLSEDGKDAKGVWWYTRVGSHRNIPPREHGGTYQWKRITPVPPGP